MRSIVCLGSINIDVTGFVPAFPLPGQTNRGTRLVFRIGGKGLNQMTAAARLGARVIPVGRVGDDALSALAAEHLRREGLPADYVPVTAGTATGAALIEIEETRGENRISVFAGANDSVTAADVLAAEPAFAGAGLFLSQLETPVPALLTGLTLARRHGLVTLLNPAPAAPLPDELWPMVDLLTPNETEAAALTDRTGPEAAARVLRDRGVGAVIVTLGGRGAYYDGPEGTFLVPAERVKAVDTVGAGDCYNGALAVALVEGRPIREAMAFASHAAAVSVTRLGAAESMPFRSDL
ncbi:MAG: ribokinase [Eubacteriales bacterium]|nr:ribokinase [Eubacteriales bacterium]